MPNPSISTVTSSSTPSYQIGSTLTLTGADFGATAGEVYFYQPNLGFNQASVSSWTDTEIVLAFGSFFIFGGANIEAGEVTIYVVPSDNVVGVSTTVTAIDAVPTTYPVPGALLFFPPGTEAEVTGGMSPIYVDPFLNLAVVRFLSDDPETGLWFVGWTDPAYRFGRSGLVDPAACTDVPGDLTLRRLEAYGWTPLTSVGPEVPS